MSGRYTRVAAFVAGVSLFACDGGKAKDAKENASPASGEAKVESKPVMKIDPHATVDAKRTATPRMVSQPGHFEVRLGDNMTHMTNLPLGDNVAVNFEGKPGRIAVAGTGEGGYPSFRVELAGWKLDELKLPVTLTAEDKAVVRFRYRFSAETEYRSDDEATRGGANTVTLESFADGVLSGTFKGSVVPTKPPTGEPIEVSGKFESKLRLRGINPDGTKAEAPKTDAKADDGNAEAQPDAKADG